MSSNPLPVILMRGISGAGKTSWIKEKYPRAYVCSADHFFTHDGKYEFDPSKLAEAHAACLTRYINVLRQISEWLITRNTFDCIVVDNTNLRAWEIAPYWSVALALGFQPQIITLMCDWRTAAERTTHAVPRQKIFQMWQILQKEELPWKETIHWSKENDR